MDGSVASSGVSGDRGTLLLVQVEPGLTVGLGRGFQISYQQPFMLKLEGTRAARFGLGDGRLTAGWYVEPLGTKVVLGTRVGLALPTGAAPGQPSVAQFGGGTFDPLLGFDLVVWGQNHGLLATIDARLPLYDNGKGYRGSVTFSGAVGPSLRPPAPLRRFQLLLMAHVRASGPERWQDEPWPESGRVSLGVTMAANWNVRKDLAVFASLQVNAWEWWRGMQFAQPVAGSVGISGFITEKKKPAPADDHEH